MSEGAPGTRGFLVVHGNRLEDLRDLVVGLIRHSPPAPLVHEVFLVQSNGMKHWLQQALADDQHGLGICAGTRLELPSRFLWEAYRSVLGRGAVPAELPFDKDALAWRLLRMLPRLATQEEVYAPLRRYLQNDTDGRRAWQLAQQVADVFDGYQQYRADWLEDWERGGAMCADAAQAWQPALWRALQSDVGQGCSATSRAAVHRAFMQRLADRSTLEQMPAGLPPRIIVFGITAMPLQSVEALAELGRYCQVILAVQNPCRFHWAHVVEGREQLKRLARQRQILKPMAAEDEGHALLAAWGKQGRDYLHQLDEFDVTAERPHYLERTELFTDPVEVPATATRLALLQSSLLNLEPAPAVPAPTPADDSIVFVKCHSAQREVEVLHDRLLDWFDADATLQPRDIMVMVPDMASFLPHIQAVFARFPEQHPRHIPFSIADSSAREAPLVQALDRLLALPESRVTLVDWLAWFEVPSLRRRFGLTEGDVAELRDALEQAGVRWGLDAAHRIDNGLPAGMPALTQNSWEDGLRRLLLGYATGEESSWCEVLAVPGVGGLDARRLGQLDEWLDAIALTRTQLTQPRRPVEWLPVLSTLLERFFAEGASDAEDRLLQRLREALQGWQRLCANAAFDDAVGVLVVREHWLADIGLPGLKARFFGGGVQFATLMPMRSIPFRRVCLLGMNDTDYPRRGTPRDFDLMAQDWRPGDRSRREDDRYLFLEALLSARERLYISWQAHRVTDNAAQPPSVVVAQLHDELRRRHAPTPALHDIPAQPLQPFSLQYFRGAEGPTTYADEWHGAHHGNAGAGPTLANEPTAAKALPGVITLPQMVRLLRQPVEVFWRSRLEVRLDSIDDAAEADEPFEVDALQDHAIGRQLLEDLPRRGAEEALQRLLRRGQLPLGSQGRRQAERLRDQATRVLQRAQSWQQRYPTAEPPLALALAGSPALQDVVPDLRRNGRSLLNCVCLPRALWQGSGRSRQPRHHRLLVAWTTHVAMCAAGHDLTTVVCAVDGEIVLPPLDRSRAHEHWAQWLEAWQAAWRTPLPVACTTAFKFLQMPDPDSDTLAEAFEGGAHQTGEREYSPYLARSFATFSDIADGTRQWAPPLYGGLLDALRDPEEAE